MDSQYQVGTTVVLATIDLLLSMSSVHLSSFLSWDGRELVVKVWCSKYVGIELGRILTRFLVEMRIKLLETG